eukprot:gene9070-18792_t
MSVVVNTHKDFLKTMEMSLIRRASLSFALPNIPGVEALSKQESKKDLKEIERNLQEDSDSEESIKSDDILPSTYPVKPRRTPKLANKPIKISSHIEDDNEDGRDIGLDECLEFLKAVETNRHDIFEAEKEREKLEVQYLALRDMFVATTKRFRKEKQEHENLIYALQGLCLRNLRINSAYNQQNSMLYDVLSVLKRRKEAAIMIDEESEKLKENINQLIIKKIENNDISNNNINNNVNIIKTYQNETHILRVKVNDPKGGSGASREELFYYGQCISTPMGDGIIESIRPVNASLVIRLPFGKLYAAIARVVNWGQAYGHGHGVMSKGDGSVPDQSAPDMIDNSKSPITSTSSMLDMSSDTALIHKWTNLQNNLKLSSQIANDIVIAVRTAGGHRHLQSHIQNNTNNSSNSNGNTNNNNAYRPGSDGGDATDNDDSQSIADSITLGGDIEMDVDNNEITMTTNTSDVSSSSSSFPFPTLSSSSLLLSQNNNSSSNSIDRSPKLQSSSSSSHMTSRSQTNKTSSSSNSGSSIILPAIPFLPPPETSTSTSMTVPMSYSASAVSSSVSHFQRDNTNYTATSISSLSSVSSPSSRDSMRFPLGYDSLPISFIPPATAPLLLDKAINKNTATVQLYQQALSSNHIIQGSNLRDTILPETIEMQNLLESLLIQTACIEQRQLSAVKQVEYIRRRMSQVIQDMTMTRLSMFSRRVRHSALLHTSSVNRYGQGQGPPMLNMLQHQHQHTSTTLNSVGNGNGAGAAMMFHQSMAATAAVPKVTGGGRWPQSRERQLEKQQQQQLLLLQQQQQQLQHSAAVNSIEKEESVLSSSSRGGGVGGAVTVAMTGAVSVTVTNDDVSNSSVLSLDNVHNNKDINDKSRKKVKEPSNRTSTKANRTRRRSEEVEVDVEDESHEEFDGEFAMSEISTSDNNARGLESVDGSGSSVQIEMKSGSGGEKQRTVCGSAVTSTGIAEDNNNINNNNNDTTATAAAVHKKPAKRRRRF